MRPALVLLTAAAAIALAAIAVDRTHDGGTLVPPPENVAEEFVRQLLAGRSEQAQPLLADALRSRVTVRELDDLGRELEARLGSVGNVLAEGTAIDDDRASATTVLDGARGKKILWFELFREEGQWTIESFGESPPDDRAALAL